MWLIRVAAKLAAKQVELLRNAEGANSWVPKKIRAGPAGDLTLDITATGDGGYDTVASLFTETPRWYCQWVNKPHRNRCIADFSGFASELSAMALHPDGLNMGVGQKNGEISLIDASTGDTVLKYANGHLEGVTCLSFSMDGKAAVSGGHDHQVIVWDSISGSAVQKLSAHGRVVTAVTWLERAKRKGDNSHGRLFASASMDSSIKIWEQRQSKTHASARRITANRATNSYYEMIWMKVCGDALLLHDHGLTVLHPNGSATGLAALANPEPHVPPHDVYIGNIQG